MNFNDTKIKLALRLGLSACLYLCASSNLYANPTLTLPANLDLGQPGVTTTFSATNGNAIVVNDASGGGADILTQVSVDIDSAQLTLSQTTGLISVSGNGSNEIVVNGPPSAVNAALDGLTLTTDATTSTAHNYALSVNVYRENSAGFINEGFELPDFPQNAGYNLVADTSVSGWGTSAADNQMEIWETGHNGVSSWEGDQFAEHNANLVSTLSQVITPPAGMQLTFAFAHRGRSGVDSVQPVITDLGADGVPGGGDDVIMGTAIFSTDNTAWREYILPVGIASGNPILFESQSLSAAGGSPSAGNLLDAVRIFDSTASDTGQQVMLYYDHDGDGISNENDLDDDNDGVTDLIETESFYADWDGLNLITGDSPQVFTTNTNGSSLPTDVTVHAPTELSTRISAMAGGLFNYQYTGAVAGTTSSATLSFSNSALPRITTPPASLDVSAIEQSDRYTFTAINAPIGFRWVVNSSANTDITISGASITFDGSSTAGTGAAPFEEFDIMASHAIDGIEISQMSISASSNNNGRWLIGFRPDTDGDGILNDFDLDSDNDGLPDVIESGGMDADGDGIYDGAIDPVTGIPTDAGVTGTTPNDFDSDGVSDYIDLDSDNDGLTDTNEAGGTDADGDGAIDGFIDTNNDGWNDATATANLPINDFDTDSQPDYLDLDSDNDGLTDANESGSTDADGDGAVDGFNDSDGNGFNDSTASTPINAPDLDTDGMPDHLDIDADNDGITDATEAGGTDNNGDGEIDGFADTNNDGLDDNTAINPLDDPNTDGSGNANHLDYDSDGDGIPDAIEGNIDSDVDGIANYLDLDSDNDGIPDSEEGGALGVDTDADGIDDAFDFDANYTGVDANNDGIDDYAATLDFDEDNTPDYLDADSDNDGITDATEAGLTDADDDGEVDGFSDANNDGLDDAIAAVPAPLTDTDTDGQSDYLDLDSDNDGVPDAVETVNGVVDTDSDGKPDHLDVDSDDDGLTDTTEAGGLDLDGNGVIDGFSDGNGDGVDDAVLATPLPINDSDGDSAPDYQEVDSDADGIPDATEAGSNPNNPIDTDSDGTPDYREEDSDKDGIPDSVEAGTDASNPVDTDTDGTPDYREDDSDKDGIPDSVEAGTDASNPVDTDSNGTPDYREEDSDKDGIPDRLEGTVDTDGDNTPDYLDQDSDNDGIPDSVEAGTDASNPVDTDSDGTPDYREEDSDKDGIHDAIEAGDAPATPADTDGDSTPDYREQDSDNDGIPDSIEAGSDSTNPVDTDSNGTPDYLDLDSDGDGISDAIEAGADASNPLDTDSNGVPDFLEQDSDKDGISDTVEAGSDPTSPIDSDSDGIPDYRALDSDNDGTPDNIEAGADPANPVDTDGDGTPDYQEPPEPVTPPTGPMDSDSDGIPNDVEGSIDSDADGVPDYLDIDSDNDGLIDSYEAGTDPTQPLDTDGDGLADYVDLDSDNDSISDVLEAGGSDADGDGIVDGFNDINGDGHDDATALNPHADTDFDGDGHVNRLDLDSDNDGLPDVWETLGLSADTNGDGQLDDLTDINGDGLADNYMANSLIDIDGDNSPNHLDLDSDGDGSPDLSEAGGDDLNGDGLVDAWTDTDGDGIVDAADVDTTGGEDRDNDGIDDFADPDYVIIEDTDGDGIVDLFDSNIFGDGYMPFTSGGQAVTLSQLPDIDGNNVADVYEFSGSIGAPSAGMIYTGLDGSGCSIGTRNTREPLLPMLALLAAASMLYRRRVVNC